MGHNFNYITITEEIIPVIFKFTDKNCPSYKIEEKNIIIDFDKELYYTIPEDLKQKKESDNDEEFYFEEYNHFED